MILVIGGTLRTDESKIVEDNRTVTLFDRMQTTMVLSLHGSSVCSRYLKGYEDDILSNHKFKCQLRLRMENIHKLCPWA